jgi:hypothetical protein
MKQLIFSLTSTLLLFASIVFGSPAEVQLKNGKSWKGEIGQIVSVEWKGRRSNNIVEGEITTATADYIVVGGELILIEYIISIKGDKDSQEPDPDVTSVDNAQDATDDDLPSTQEHKKATASEGELPRGVFVLPWKGTVGEKMRPTELRRLVEYIETNYGLGQIIVIEINSGGGAVHKWSEIRDVIFDAKERHRIIAWIDNAGSAAASTAFTMDEIYYRTHGYLGSCTMYSGPIENVADDPTLYAWIKEFQGVLAKSSWNPLVAGSLVKSWEAFSYDVDPITEEITYYADTSGATVLSDRSHNNMLNPKEALRCKLSDGTADTGEELAKLLDLDEWIEIDQFGREIASDWEKTLASWEEDKQDLMQRVQGDVDGKTQKQRLINQIKAIEELIRWEKKLGETAASLSNGYLSKEGLIRLRGMILRLRQQLQFVDE